MLVHGVKGGLGPKLQGSHGTGQHPQHCQHHPQDADDAGEWGDHTIGGGGGGVRGPGTGTYMYIYIYIHMWWFPFGFPLKPSSKGKNRHTQMGELCHLLPRCRNLGSNSKIALGDPGTWLGLNPSCGETRTSVKCAVKGSSGPANSILNLFQQLATFAYGLSQRR